jgi:glycosyltransferase involved in cell wall biosynthesis
LHGASAIVTLNSGASLEARRLLGSGAASRTEITVIPTCVDVGRFRRVDADTAPLDAVWRGRLLFVYMGAAGFWQDPESLAGFFGVVERERPDAAFLCLLRTGAADMRRALQGAGLSVCRVEEGLRPDDLPRWLSAARAGVVWYRPAFSRLGNFPTKLGEYLACGLPVLVAGAVADSVDLVVRERVGVVVRAFSPEAYREALAGLLELLDDADTPARCRRVAEQDLSVSVGSARYARIYRRLAGGAA